VDYPALNLVTLGVGTLFYIDLPDGTISAERELVEPIQAEVVTVGPIFNTYDVIIDGLLMTILVDVRDLVT
jgi:hypothetical protein